MQIHLYDLKFLASSKFCSIFCSNFNIFNLFNMQVFKTWTFSKHVEGIRHQNLLMFVHTLQQSKSVVIDGWPWSIGHICETYMLYCFKWYLHKSEPTFRTTDILQNTKCWKNLYSHNNYESANSKSTSLIYKNLVFINRTKIKEDSKHAVHATENKEALNSLWNAKEYW